jgi:hypothetical protein
MQKQNISNKLKWWEKLQKYGAKKDMTIKHKTEITSLFKAQQNVVPDVNSQDRTS